jgi:hypothetical protein
MVFDIEALYGLLGVKPNRHGALLPLGILSGMTD